MPARSMPRSFAALVLSLGALPSPTSPSDLPGATRAPRPIASCEACALDIRAFGADPARPTLNDAAFQAAVRTARSLGGGTIRVPAGTFAVTRPIQLGPGLADVAMTGEGRGSVIAATFPGPVILIEGGARLRIETLRVTGRFSKGVYVTGHSRSIAVDHCWIDGATDDDHGKAGAIGGVVVGDADGVTVTYSSFEANGNPEFEHGADIFALNGSNHTDLEIIGNRCSSTHVTFNIGLFDTSWSLVSANRVRGARVARSLENGGYGIMLYRTPTAAESGHNTVTSNVVTGTEGSGIYLQDSPFSTVIGNTVSRTASRQADVKLQVAGVAVGREGPVAIVGNSISESSKAGISIGGSGHSVVANLIDDAAGPGVYLRDAQNATISDNVISRSSVGIRALPSPTPDGLTIRGNQVIGSKGPGMLFHGLRHSIVDANHLSDNRGDGISLVDSEGNDIRGNLIRAAARVGTSSCGIRFAHSRRNNMSGNRSDDASPASRLICGDPSSDGNVDLDAQSPSGK